jgi:hypothetical protein
VLVNGAQGIGTGFSTTILQYNPLQIIDNILLMMDKNFNIADKIEDLEKKIATHCPSTTLSNDDLDKKAQAAEDGGKTAIKARNASEKVWNNIFKTTASYVNLIANGDVLFINQCGLDASAEHTTTKSIPGGLVNFEGTPIVKSAGAVEIKYDADTNAKAYASIITSTNAVIEQHGDMIIVTVGNEKVYILLDTHHKTVANELPSGTELSLYGAAFNGYGVGQLTQAKNIKAL